MAAPVITVYKNGDTYFNGKRLVLNRKEIRSFDALLDRVTKDTSSKVAVRSIRTPLHGHRVATLDNLENGGIYVAVGPEKFKKLEYKELSNLPIHRQKPPEQIIRPVVHSRVVVSGRARKVAAAEIFANKNIFVYRNGDDRSPAFKIHLDKRILQTNMNTILQFITEKVNLRTGAVRSIFTLDGIEVQESTQIKSMEKYVAVGYGRKFLKMAYTESNHNNTTPRRGGPKVKSTSSEPPFRKRKHKPPVKAMSQGHVKSPPKDEDSSKSSAVSKPTSEEENRYEAVSINMNENEAHLSRAMTQDLSRTSSRSSTKNDTEDRNETASLQNEAADGIATNETHITEANLKEAEGSKRKSVSEKEKTDASRRAKENKARKSVASDAGSVKSKKKKDTKKTQEDVHPPQEETEEDKEATVFKATGDLGESATAVKDTPDTNVDKPLDMLPAEEVEEELNNEDEEIGKNAPEKEAAKSSSPQIPEPEADKDDNEAEKEKTSSSLSNAKKE